MDSVRDGVRKNEDEYHPCCLVFVSTEVEEVSAQEVTVDKEVTRITNTTEQEAEEKVIGEM